MLQEICFAQWKTFQNWPALWFGFRYFYRWCFSSYWLRWTKANQYGHVRTCVKTENNGKSRYLYCEFRNFLKIHTLNLNTTLFMWCGCESSIANNHASHLSYLLSISSFQLLHHVFPVVISETIKLTSIVRLVTVSLSLPMLTWEVVRDVDNRFVTDSIISI